MVLPVQDKSLMNENSLNVEKSVNPVQRLIKGEENCSLGWRPSVLFALGLAWRQQALPLPTRCRCPYSDCHLGLTETGDGCSLT